MAELSLPSRVGVSRVGGIDLNKPRIRAALSAALALAAAPHGFTVADHAARVRAMAGHRSYTTRQAAYDLRKLRGKGLVSKPGRARRYQISPHAARSIAGNTYPARPGHRPDPRRRPQPAPGPQTRHLDQHRPRLRDPPHRHAEPLPRPRHHRRRGIDNILSIRILQASNARSARRAWARQRECLDLVAVAAAVFVLHDVAGLDRAGDGAAGAAVGDACAGLDVEQPRARVAAMHSGTRTRPVRKLQLATPGYLL